MFSSISHDMRTPINAIQNSLNYIKPVLEKADAQSTEVDSVLNKQQSPSLFFFDVCITSLAFLLTLVNDTLDYSQLQAGKFTLNFTKCNLLDIVVDITKLISV